MFFFEGSGTRPLILQKLTLMLANMMRFLKLIFLINIILSSHLFSRLNISINNEYVIIHHYFKTHLLHTVNPSINASFLFNAPLSLTHPTYHILYIIFLKYFVIIQSMEICDKFFFLVMDFKSLKFVLSLLFFSL